MAEANTINILIASDLHLGFKEKDPIRDNDSFNALEEILQIAQHKNVDFILLGGDLFHLNKPSKNTLYKTVDLLQHYCLGQRQSELEVLSDPYDNFGKRIASDSVVTVNYENSKFSISMPVFSIHGNHDDNTGVNNLSAIDILSAAGLLNHFGKQTNANKIEISPVVLRKGTTTLALYGLGSIRDVRLYKLFDDKKVVFKRNLNQMECYNMFVLHQNRSEYSEKSYVPEKFLDDFLDLVVWGHEHECKIKPEQSRDKKFKIMQPGSTVATQMHKSETKPKHIAVLRLNGRIETVEEIPLRTVRQMYIETVKLSEVIEKQASEKATEEKVKKYCRTRIRKIIDEAKQKRLKQQPKKPLIQLKIDCSDGYDIFNRYQFGEEFKESVANPENVVHFLKNSSPSSNLGGASDNFGVDVENVSLEDLVRNYFKEKEKQLRLLDIHDMMEAVDNFVCKSESKEAIVDATQKQMKKIEMDVQKSYKGRLDRNEIVKFVCRMKGMDLDSDTIQQSSAQLSVFQPRPSTSTAKISRSTGSRSVFPFKSAIVVGTARIPDTTIPLSSSRLSSYSTNLLDTPDISHERSPIEIDVDDDDDDNDKKDGIDIIDLTADDDCIQEPPLKRLKDY